MKLLSHCAARIVSARTSTKRRAQKTHSCGPSPSACCRYWPNADLPEERFALLGKRVLEDLAVFHDDFKILGGVGDKTEIVERVTVDKDQIGQCALLHNA